jgi:competence protein ComGC
LKKFFKPLNNEKGLTLAELSIVMTLSTVVSLAGANLMSEYMASAKTLKIQADGNAELIRIIGDLTREFQTSRQAQRACILQRTAGESTDANQNLNDFQCASQNLGNGVVLTTDGLGFDIDNALRPQRAFINTCQAFNPQNLPSGKGGRHTPLRSPKNLNWAGASQTCPAECEGDTRPVVRYIGPNGLVENRQYPAVKGNGNLDLWGTIVCAAQFRDVRDLQNLSSRDFVAQYLNVLAFVGRSRHDIKFRRDTNGQLQTYIWMSGGTVLEFLDSQEMSIFRCRTGDPNC